MRVIRSGYVTYPECAGTCPRCACCFECHESEAPGGVAPCPTCNQPTPVYRREDQT